MNRKVGEGEIVGGEEFVVDLATLAHFLDTIMKQPLNSRLRFLFDIHDLNGDGFLNEQELKAVMDSLLGIFEKDPSRIESYLMAISSFVNTSFQFGGSKESKESLKLSFNEFLLSILSQPVFVRFFETSWKLGSQGKSPNREFGKVTLTN